MNNDFKKGFFFSAGFLAFLLIPTGIYFASSTNWGEKFSKQKVSRYCNNYANKYRENNAAWYKKNAEQSNSKNYIEEDIKEIFKDCNQRNKITKYDICMDNVIYNKRTEDDFKALSALYDTDRDAWYREIVDRPKRLQKECANKYL